MRWQYGIPMVTFHNHGSWTSKGRANAFKAAKGHEFSSVHDRLALFGELVTKRLEWAVSDRGFPRDIAEALGMGWALPPSKCRKRSPVTELRRVRRDSKTLLPVAALPLACGTQGPGSNGCFRGASKRAVGRLFTQYRKVQTRPRPSDLPLAPSDCDKFSHHDGRGE